MPLVDIYSVLPWLTLFLVPVTVAFVYIFIFHDNISKRKNRLSFLTFVLSAFWVSSLQFFWGEVPLPQAPRVNDKVSAPSDPT